MHAFDNWASLQVIRNIYRYFDIYVILLSPCFAVVTIPGGSIYRERKCLPQGHKVVHDRKELFTYRQSTNNSQCLYIVL